MTDWGHYKRGISVPDILVALCIGCFVAVLIYARTHVEPTPLRTPKFDKQQVVYVHGVRGRIISIDRYTNALDYHVRYADHQGVIHLDTFEEFEISAEAP